MLKSIYIVTLLVLNAPGSEETYRDELGYKTVASGAISQELSEAWDKPGMVGRDYVLMQPESDEEVYLRFITAPEKGNYEPMKTLGWNAVELQATDPDAMAHELDPSRFEIIGPPKYLTDKENIRAMQVLGPDRELLYLTHVLDPAQSTFRIGTATTRVDRVFIMVLGTSDLEATTRFYSTYLGKAISGPWPYRVTVLSEAWGKPEDTVYDLSIAQLEEDFLIEIDQYPEEAERRSDSGLGLPFGPAMVSFRVNHLAKIAQGTDGKLSRLDEAPYQGREIMVLEGPSGEWIELVGGD